jgi:hypothetical protein
VWLSGATARGPGGAAGAPSGCIRRTELKAATAKAGTTASRGGPLFGFRSIGVAPRLLMTDKLHDLIALSRRPLSPGGAVAEPEPAFYCIATAMVDLSGVA